jgi:mannose-6-phosphate isomerase-like protein (cupin superfamily)
MNANNFDGFEFEARAAGFDEAVARKWAPNKVVETHSHPFDADAVVMQGEMWLTCGDNTCHLKSGDTFSLASGVLHAERYGPQGTTYWVARRKLSRNAP